MAVFSFVERKLVSMTMDELLTLMVVSGVIILPVIFVPVLLYYRHERWKLGLEHERQLKALELGRGLPGEGNRESWFSPLRVGLIIGAGVPLGAFLSALVTSVSIGFHDGIWIATSTVGLASVISGSIIAGRAYSESKASPTIGEGKPFVEEDAYDVVSARG
jgi:hypothetical protein